MERESEKRMHPDIAIDAKKLNIHARNALEEDSAFWRIKLKNSLLIKWLRNQIQIKQRM